MGSRRGNAVAVRPVRSGDITRHVEAFLRPESEVAPSRRRERSWDFCFNYFQSTDRPTESLELSCLHLGYYLASWGMLRGSSFLFRETNLGHYQPVIEVIEHHRPAMSGVDVSTYRDEGTLDAINAAWRDLRKALLPDEGRSITLVSKVMMGVWGCLPSFDYYFVQTFRDLSDTKAERGAFRRDPILSLRLLGDLYSEHADEIEALRRQYPTLDFMTGGPTDRPMTQAKVIDIFGFQRAYGGGT